MKNISNCLKLIFPCVLNFDNLIEKANINRTTNYIPEPMALSFVNELQHFHAVHLKQPYQPAPMQSSPIKKIILPQLPPSTRMNKPELRKNTMNKTNSYTFQLQFNMMLWKLLWEQHTNPGTVGENTCFPKCFWKYMIHRVWEVQDLIQSIHFSH